MFELFAKHRENNPSLRWRQLSQLIFPIVHTHPLNRRVTYQILTRLKVVLLKCLRIMPLFCIRSLFLIVLWSFNLNYLLVLLINYHFHLLKINDPQNKLNFGKLRLGCLDPSLVCKLKLQTVDAVELQPLLLLLAPVTPRPRHLPLVLICWGLLKV